MTCRKKERKRIRKTNQNFHFCLILLAIVDPDDNQTIFSRASEISIQQGCGSVLYAKFTPKTLL